MRNIISLVLLFCSLIAPLILKSQSFGEFGTKWYYTQYHFLDAGVGYVEIESVGDTNIDGQLCHHLIRHGYDCSPTDSDIYLYEENGIVKYFLPGANQFLPLYNFNLQTGDTMKGYVFTFGHIDSFIMKITGVENIVINDIPSKEFIVENLSEFSFSETYTDTLLENIGSTYYLLPQFGACDAGTGPLRCLENETFGFYSTGVAPSCDYISTGVSELSSNDEKIRVKPNPYNDHLEFVLTKPEEKFSLIISDVEGKEIFRRDNLNANFILETAAWSPGMYFLQLISENQRQAVKMVKE